MRAYEFITEAISLSTMRHELVPVIEKEMNRPINVELKTKNDLFQYIKQNVIEPLSRPISKILGGNITITLDGASDDKVLGTSTYDTISLSPKHVTTFIPVMFKRYLQSDNPTLKDIGEEFYISLLYKTLKSITHEAVHMAQHIPQPSGNTEYRSSLFKNKNDFIQAVQNVGTDKETPLDKKIYMSSIQEIPAYAHNIALEIMNANTNFLSDDLQDIDDSIEVLKDILKNLGSGDDFGSRTLRYYNVVYNYPRTAGYQVYKRLMKMVYQELTNYLKYWVGTA